MAAETDRCGGCSVLEMPKFTALRREIERYSTWAKANAEKQLERYKGWMLLSKEAADEIEKDEQAAWLFLHMLEDGYRHSRWSYISMDDCDHSDIGIIAHRYCSSNNRPITIVPYRMVQTDVLHTETGETGVCYEYVSPQESAYFFRPQQILSDEDEEGTSKIEDSPLFETKEEAIKSGGRICLHYKGGIYRILQVLSVIPAGFSAFR